MSRAGCERLNPLRQVFLVKNHDFGSWGEGDTKPPGGTKIRKDSRVDSELKINDFRILVLPWVGM